MDINKLLPILASQPPAQRVQLAAQLGLNAQALQQLETIAERNGLPLRGGRCVAAEGGADGGDLDGEEDESGAPTEGTLTLSTVRYEYLWNCPFLLRPRRKHTTPFIS